MSELKFKVGDKARWVQKSPEDERPDDCIEEGEIVTVEQVAPTGNVHYAVIAMDGYRYVAYEGNLAPIDDPAEPQYETLTVRADEVRVGDRIGGEVVESAELGNSLVRFLTPSNNYYVNRNWQLVIERPLKPACPRGVMTTGSDGVNYLNGKPLANYETEEYYLMYKRIADLWNAAELADGPLGENRA